MEEERGGMMWSDRDHYGRGEGGGCCGLIGTTMEEEKEGDVVV